MIWSGIGGRARARDSRTLTVKLWVALRLGVPSSVTRTVMILVLGLCSAEGDQVNKPFAGSMAAPAGALVPRLKVRVLAGRSTSLAELVTINSTPATTVRSAIGAKTGAALVSRTIIMKLCVALRLG